MFEKKYEDRLRSWVELRKQLETSNNPLQKVIDFYKKVKLVRIQVDPYDKSSWPDPWTLLNDNVYCRFAVLLGIAYTLQLTERFSRSNFEIHITRDKENSTMRYLLYVDDQVVDCDKNEPILANTLSLQLQIETKYPLETY
jgi:hypothetical protein|tara:strand:+ start:5526 stop:5948 length:423 start_codon:yes stop_codon:yes gene_type:complete